MSLRIFRIEASTSFWIWACFCSTNMSTEMVGPVSFLGGGGALGLVRSVCWALTSVSCFVYRALPLLAAAGAAGAARAAGDAAARANAQVHTNRAFENRCSLLVMVSPLFVTRSRTSRRRRRDESDWVATASARRALARRPPPEQ